MTERTTDEDGNRLPWEILEIKASSSDGHMYLHGLNHYTEGTAFCWAFTPGIFGRDPEFVSRRYDFRRAAIAPDARKLLVATAAKWTREQCSAIAGLSTLLDACSL